MAEDLTTGDHTSDLRNKDTNYNLSSTLSKKNISGATLHNTMLECGQGLLLNITSVPSLYCMFSDFIDYFEWNGLPQFNLLR